MLFSLKQFQKPCGGSLREVVRKTQHLTRCVPVLAQRAEMIPGAKNVTFYKRELPTPPATAFSSPEGVTLFQEAMKEGTMFSFFKLIEQFHTQMEPSFCGLTSLTMILNALSIDPRRTWKAPWRWFDETLLDCCKPLEQVKKDGTSLIQVACLARCNGAEVGMHYYGTFQLEEFRNLVKEACTTGNFHLIVTYSRPVLSQTGQGHFSPIGGYHAGQDQVLILDTARFKYPPHWVSLELLYRAMAEPDVSAPRGFLTLKAPKRPLSICYSLNQAEHSWTKAEQYVQSLAPRLVQDMAAKGVPLDAILKELVLQCPLESVEKFMAVRVSGCIGEIEMCPVHAIQFYAEFQTLPLHQEVQKQLEARFAPDTPEEHQVGRVTALLLLKPLEEWPGLEHTPELRKELEALMDLSKHPMIASEIEFLRHQMHNLREI